MSEATGKNSLATAGMVCGIVGASLGVFGFIFTWWAAIPLGLLGVIFGLIGKDRYAADPSIGGKGKAWAGFWTGLVAVIFGCGGMIFVFAVLSEASDGYYSSMIGF